MLKKLRIKFVVINMSIVTLMLCVILGMVFQFTKANLERENLRMMQNIAGSPFSLGVPNKPGDDVRLPYFMLQVSTGGDVITRSSGYFDLSDDEFLAELVQEIVSSQKNIGVIEEYRLRYYRESAPLSQILVVTDISSELATLRGLMENSLIIGAVSFLTFLGISILLAKWAVKPVDQAWKQQRQFVADASHELKTPLTVIMTNAELMQTMEFDEESRSKFSQNILIMSKQMRGLIEQMLTLARTDNALSDTVFSSVDFSRLVSDAMLPFEPVFFEKGLTLTSQISENIRVTGAEAQLRQVLEILLDNAQKYSKDKGTTWVTLRKYRKKRCILTVANEGDTIPPEELKNLFKRFYRVDKARSRTGSFGLGLSIAERIVTQHKGKIWAESKDGINSFSVELRCF